MSTYFVKLTGFSGTRKDPYLFMPKLRIRQQTNFSLAASFWGICLLSAFILLRRLKLASVSIFHSYRPQRRWQVNQSQFIDGETSFAFSNASSVLNQKESGASSCIREQVKKKQRQRS